MGSKKLLIIVSFIFILSSCKIIRVLIKDYSSTPKDTFITVYGRTYNALNNDSKLTISDKSITGNVFDGKEYIYINTDYNHNDDKIMVTYSHSIFNSQFKISLKTHEEKRVSITVQKNTTNALNKTLHENYKHFVNKELIWTMDVNGYQHILNE